ncbi:MAG TPA: GNAT family N-acetyltransferase [candidate division Zixibacteria bacterium]|nr:GNAT family N-acetyltransferase [candidate division Zixibacteria bacterium]
MTAVPDISLRTASDADSEFFFEVTKAALGKYIELTWGWDEDQQRRLHEEKWHIDNSYVVIAEGREMGTLRYEEGSERFYVRSLYLLPAWQNRGIGTRIMRLIMDRASSAGLPVGLHVLKNNPARRLYERLGFVIIDQNETHFEMEFKLPG